MLAAMRVLSFRTGAHLAALLLAMSVAGNAAAQASNKAAAEALFDEGRKLMASSNFAEACAKFAASQSIDPAPGTLLNLANCYEKNGQTASAWATYREAAADARQANRQDFEKTALKRANALEPKLTRVTVRVASPARGMEVRRDGVVVAEAEWNTPIPVDPGERTIEVSAPGKRPWTGKVTVPAGGGKLTFDIPPLEDAPEEPPLTAPRAAGDPREEAPSAASPSSPSTGSPSTTRTIGWVTLGVGAAGLVVGGAMSLAASSKYDESLAFCRPEDANRCTQQGVDLRDDARSRGTIATVAFGLGAAAVAAGLVLVLTAPKADTRAAQTTRSLAVAPTLGGLAAWGAF
jgi:tetratricopeptide (TPR) repeat protein